MENNIVSLTVKQLSKAHLQFNLEKENLKFFKSCISQGLIPKGLRSSFNCARDVNDGQFIQEVQAILNNESSRKLDLILKQSLNKFQIIETKYENLKFDLFEHFPTARTLFINMKRKNSRIILLKCKKLKKKLQTLKEEKLAQTDGDLEVSHGSRKVVGNIYIKFNDPFNSNTEPFPLNLDPRRIRAKGLRNHRRNRPHQRNSTNPNTYVPTAQDLAARDPIVLSKQDLHLSEAAKSVCRLGPKTCPTPRGPVNEADHYKDFLQFRESLRWKWFFNKNKKPEEVDNNYVKKPWDTRSDKKSPRCL